MTSLSDVADPATCHFCAGDNIDWHRNRADCHDCTATFTHRRGLVTDREGPHDWAAVSALLHQLRRQG